MTSYLVGEVAPEGSGEDGSTLTCPQLVCWVSEAYSHLCDSVAMVWVKASIFLSLDELSIIA